MVGDTTEIFNMTFLKNAVVFTLSIALFVLAIAVGALCRLFRPRHLETGKVLSNEPNITSPLLGHWRNSWKNSWSDSWTNSWDWLRRGKHDQVLPTFHPSSKPSSVNPLAKTENIAPLIDVDPTERPLQYTVLSGDRARRVLNASPPYFDRFICQKIVPWDTEVPASPQHWRLANKPRKSRPSRGRSISPYRPSNGIYHSQPIDIPSKKKRKPRPTFPLPEKLIWKALTPYERAGMVWYHNGAH